MARYGSWPSHATAVIFTLDQPHRPGWFYACLSGVLQVMITGLPEFPMCRSARTCISSVRGGTSRSGIDNEGRTRNERDRVRSSVTWSHSGNRLFVELTYKLGLDWRPLPRGLVRLSYLSSIAIRVQVGRIFNYSLCLPRKPPIWFCVVAGVSRVFVGK